MPFLIFSNTIIQFVEIKLIRRFYTTTKALLIIKQIKLIDKKKFTEAVLDEKLKTFVIYVTALEILKMLINSLQTAQIIKNAFMQVAAL